MSMLLARPSPLTPRQVTTRGRVAFLGAVVAWSFVILAVAVSFNVSGPNDTLGPLEWATGGAFFASAILWVAMWMEYARERPREFPLLWGFLLLTGPVLGPLLFYHFVWRRRYAAQAV
jgi:hypothetical protein